MKKVYFKSGKSVKITLSFARQISDLIIKGQAKQWQILSDDSGDPRIMINLSEVDYIQ